MMSTLAYELVLQGVQMFLVVAIAPLVMGVTRKVRAHLLRRIGPPVLQPYRDIWKLMHKEAVLAYNASWIYRVAPYFIFAVTWVAAALIPTYASGLLFSWSADLIAIVALLGTARFSLALAGMDVGTSFGGIGSSREMMIASLAEPAMLMVSFSLSLISGTTSPAQIITFILGGGVGIEVSMGLSLAALIMVAVAENGRIPIDNPATHLELTMVHEAMVLEYSGRHLALMEGAAMVRLTLFMALIGGIFAPWGIAVPGAAVVSEMVGLAAFLAKCFALATALGVFETLIAKMRVFRYADFLGGALLLGLLATIFLYVSEAV